MLVGSCVPLAESLVPSWFSSLIESFEESFDDPDSVGVDDSLEAFLVHTVSIEESLAFSSSISEGVESSFDPCFMVVHIIGLKSEPI